MSSPRMPSPGPSFARAAPLRLRGPGGSLGPRVRLGMTKPNVMPDDWWVFTLWVEDDEGVIEARAVAPAAGPPPLPPLQVIGPTLANALMGLLAQEDGRQLIRMRMAEAEDEAEPWRRPLMILTAVRWDPVRKATMRDNELVAEVMRAFRRAIDIAGTPGLQG
jgi:hypothetical protein